MATNTIGVQAFIRSGLAASFTTISTTADTYVVANDGKTILHFKKTGAGNTVITVVSQAVSDGLDIADWTGTVTATTGDIYFGPFARNTFNNTANQLVFSADNVAASLLVQALQMP